MKPPSRKLSDFARLFGRSVDPYDFSLELYEQKAGKAVYRTSVPFGRQPVIESFSLVPLSEAALPAAVSAGFLTPQGGEREWVIFSRSGKMSRMTLHESPSRKSRMIDLDHDGMLDIMLQEQITEAGTGYETFLTWYRWDGEAYREHLTTNLVRNLNTFLKKSRETLITLGYDDFIRFAVSSEEFGPGNGKNRDILRALFEPHLPGYEENALPEEQNPMLREKRIVEVTFPEISENPFSLEGENGYAFNIPLRIVFEGGEYFFYRSRIELAGNPFSERQFTFTTCR